MSPQEPLPRELPCPRCEVPLSRHTLVTAVERWQVEVDACTHSCGGVWLDREDFQVDPKAKLLLNQALLAHNVPALKGLTPEGPAECPVCRVPMGPYRWKHTTVPLDRCGQCRGLWFDGHEIAAVQQQLRQSPATPVRPKPGAAPRRTLPLWARGLVGLTVLLLGAAWFATGGLGPR